MVLGLTLVAIVVYRQARIQIEQRTEQMRNEVLASFTLWQRAVEQGDGELLETLMVDGELEWAGLQRRLLQQGLLLARPQLGLEPLGAVTPDAVSVQFAPDLRQAEVTFAQPYRLTESAQTVSLEQSLHFQRRGLGWRLVKPDDDAWGGWQTVTMAPLTLQYPARDHETAVWLARRLSQALRAACQETLEGQPCPEQLGLTVRLSRDPADALRLLNRDTALFADGSLVLPTPGLLGLPADAAGRRLLYEAYASRIVPVYAAQLAIPAPLPEQQLRLLCFPEDGYAPRLFGFDPGDDRWWAEQDQGTYLGLWSAWNDAGLILRDNLRGNDINRVQLSYWQDGRKQTVFREGFARLLRYPAAGRSVTRDAALIVQQIDPSNGNSALAAIDLARCQDAECDVQPMDGFPLWSPDRRQTILVQGDDIHLGDADGKALLPLGRGFSPFWLDNGHYGFARFVQQEDGLRAEVVLGQLESGAAADQARTLLTAETLDRLLPDSGDGELFPTYVAVHPGDRRRLVIAAHRYATSGDRFFLFVVELNNPAIWPTAGPQLARAELRLQLARPPSGHPSVITPDGALPFIFSTDGRWITLSHLANRQNSRWLVDVHHVADGRTLTVTVNYPVFTARRIYMDWSADGEWLLIVDDGFLRLVAPAHNYQRFIGHQQRDCIDAAWTQPSRPD